MIFGFIASMSIIWPPGGRISRRTSNSAQKPAPVFHIDFLDLHPSVTCLRSNYHTVQFYTDSNVCMWDKSWERCKWGMLTIPRNAPLDRPKWCNLQISCTLLSSICAHVFRTRRDPVRTRCGVVCHPSPASAIRRNVMLAPIYKCGSLCVRSLLHASLMQEPRCHCEVRAKKRN